MSCDIWIEVVTYNFLVSLSVKGLVWIRFNLYHLRMDSSESVMIAVVKATKSSVDLTEDAPIVPLMK